MLLVIIGALAGVVARQRYRSAADVHAGLVETTVDVHHEELVDRCSFGDGVRPTRPNWGREITEPFRKGI